MRGNAITYLEFFSCTVRSISTVIPTTTNHYFPNPLRPQGIVFPSLLYAIPHESHSPSMTKMTRNLTTPF